MGRDVLSSKLKFTTPDGEECEGEIPDQRWWGPQYALKDLGVMDVGVHSRPMGDYRIDFVVMVTLEELKHHECIYAPDDLWDFCVNKRREFFRTIVADIHAFRYFADCMNRKKMRAVPSILQAVECEDHNAILLPEADVVQVVDEQDVSESLLPFLPPHIMNNICCYFSLFPDGISWLDVHDKHAGVFYDQAAKCSVKYQNFLAVEIDFSEELFEECEEWPSYMYPDALIERNAMIRMEGYVVHD